MGKRPRAKPRILWLLALFLLLFLLWVAWSNVAPQLTTHTVISERLPAAFDGYRIAHVSDLHNTEIGKENAKLLALLKDASPNVIAITGDTVDCRRTDVDVALAFLGEAVKIAPCFYVTGNHETGIEKKAYADYEAAMTALGVTVLHGQAVTVDRGGASISLAGIDDPTFNRRYTGGKGPSLTTDGIQGLLPADGFTVLLSHRPEFFETYVSAGVDLVLTGHVHGGQFRLPFVGGLYGPNQGILPTYDAGLYTEGRTNMIVSRGLGNSSFPIRFNNRPNLVLIELACSP